MKFDISEEERKQARHPHEYFLVNLITNHVLVFVGLLGMARDNPLLLLVVPTISIIILTYLIVRARQSPRKDSWFVMLQWQLCARRSKFFIGMIALMGLVILGLILMVGGDPSKLKPSHYALGGVAILPTMFSVLALIIMESDAVHKAGLGEAPDWLVKKYPNSAAG